MTAALLSATTFIAVLWTIGGSLTFELRGVAVTIPGFLVIAAVIYAVAASGSMTLIANRFIPVAERKNQAEAEYRYALTRLREKRRSAMSSMPRSAECCADGATMRTTIVSQTSSYIAPILPIFRILMVAADEIELIVTPLRQPAINQMLIEPRAPANLQHLLQIKTVDAGHDHHQRDDGEDPQLADELRLILLFQGVVEILVPGVELDLEPDQGKRQPDHGGEEQQAFCALLRDPVGFRQRPESR